MKNRRIFRLGAALLALVLLMLSLPTAGAKTPTLVAVNDSLPYDLEESTMPFYSDRRYYVPYSVFEHSSLGIYVSYNREDRILTLFNNVNSLFFYMNTLDTFDAEGNEYTVTALRKGGVTYVPVEFVCEKFKLGCTITETASYNLIRVTNGSQSYTNDEFINQARPLITTKIEKYEQLQQENQGTDGPADTTPEIKPGTARAVLWLDAAGYGEEEITSALDALETRDVEAAFFLDAYTEYEPELLRRICAQGHKVGFITDDIAAAEQANDRLYDAARKVTRLIYFTGQGDPADEGYINCPWTMNGEDYKYASVLADNLDGDRTETVRLTLSENGLRLVGSIITHITGKNGAQLVFAPLRETMYMN